MISFDGYDSFSVAPVELIQKRPGKLFWPPDNLNDIYLPADLYGLHNIVFVSFIFNNKK